MTGIQAKTILKMEYLLYFKQPSVTPLFPFNHIMKEHAYINSRAHNQYEMLMQLGTEEYIKDSGQERILEIYLKQTIIPKLVLCLAAPGTGKTTTIVRLLLELITLDKVAAIKNFMVLTFTKKTRNDILKKFEEKGRKDLIPRLQRTVRNFHSLAFTSLFWDKVLTDTEITNKINQIAAMTNLDLNGDHKYKVKKLIKKIKEAISQNTIQDTIQIQLQNDTTMGKIMQAYIDWLDSSYKESKTISYDYALIKFIDRIKEGRNPLKIDLSKIELLIVDEFQDSNPAQMKIVECILERNPGMRLLLMGDIDQTIYTWRGTDLVALDSFISEYDQKGDYEKVTLENTHRLGQAVLKASQRLIKSRDGYLRFRNRYYQNYEPVPRNIKDNHPPLVIEFQSEYSEVNWVIAKIRELVDAKIGINYRDITVLLRSFRFTYFFNKFKYQNQRLSIINGIYKIPFTVKSDQNHQNMQNILAWFVYFYKRKYNRLESLQKQIIIITKHIKPSPTTLKNMISSNVINRVHVGQKRLKSQQANEWHKFFIDFESIEKMIKEKECFSDVFSLVYEKLMLGQRCIELSQNEITEFIDYLHLLQAQMDKDQLKKEPVFAVVEELIRNGIYQPKSKAKNSKKKDPSEGNQKITAFLSSYKNTQNTNKSNETKEQPNKQTQQQRERIELFYQNQSDKVQFQTVYKAKGLEFKVVFICSLNFDYKHDEYEPAALPRNRKEALRNDAERERQRALDFNRYVVKEEEELRVIYTALTRTSKYSFITASVTDCQKPDFSIKHPHFEHLYNNCEHMNIPLDKQEDIEFKEAYKQHVLSSKDKKQKKKQPASQNILEMFSRQRQ